MSCQIAYLKITNLYPKFNFTVIFANLIIKKKTKNKIQNINNNSSINLNSDIVRKENWE